MNENIQAAIAKVQAASKPLTSLPWEPDQPSPQPLYSYRVATQSWEPSSPASHPHAQTSSTSLSSSKVEKFGGKINKIALFSWNIDFMLPHGDARMRAALAHLEGLLSSSSKGGEESGNLNIDSTTTAAVIFLQECTPSDLAVIGATPWVRAAFRRTDVDAQFWGNGAYGTTVLVDRRLRVRGVDGDVEADGDGNIGLEKDGKDGKVKDGVFRVHFEKTRFERDALFVDVIVPSLVQGDEEKQKYKVIRLCNTHLESLAQEPAYRPPQLALAARFMREEGVHAAMLAGDLNAITPLDADLPAQHNLTDAHLHLHSTKEGYTWGQQAPPELRQLYGCSRMDKILFCGGVQVESFARIGEDVVVGDEDQARDICAWGGGERGWVSDHLGVGGVFGVV
ncbi:Endonuclease/exonuclease/phosphatase [Astrocystis sublimbata]|nr:Endonuclease/exonuclease/phosphatase [Astrocystis sublimbata]